jgi:alkanesulfonate monooxygenase SsuD/methylene tetrahydromethanopterin reductase-like flavin-dependent oxidoreductase (luciferase family)
MAKLGIGVLAILQRDRDSTAAKIERYNTFYRNLTGQGPIPAVVAARVILGDTDEEARMLAASGYEHYSKIGEMIKRMDPEVMLENTMAPHVYGTPETSLERIRSLRDSSKQITSRRSSAMAGYRSSWPNRAYGVSQRKSCRS